MGYRLQALSSSLFDHSPQLLCHQDKPTVYDTFRFEILWSRVPGFNEVVQEAWNESVHGVSPLSTLFFKLQCTSVSLRQWSKKLFGNSRVELHMANKIIHRLDIAQEDCHMSSEEMLL
jgi:hypothetical protein